MVTFFPMLLAVALLGYAFVSNVALAVLPHEPMVIWCGPRLGVFTTALIATAGTVAAAWTDHRLFARSISRRMGPGGTVQRWFARAPFAVLALSGLTPLPFFPFKLLAFTARYPRGRYLAAVAAGRLPRYLLLAWLGVAVRLPTWALALTCLLLLIPILRVFRWPTPNAS